MGDDVIMKVKRWGCCKADNQLLYRTAMIAAMAAGVG